MPIAPRSNGPSFDLGLAALAVETDLILCDVWGVIHNGVRHFEAATDALCRFRASGGTVVLITNAPVPEAQVVARMDQLGVPRAVFDGVATSGDVTADLVVAAGCPPIFNIGPDVDMAIYREAGRRGSRVPPRVRLEEATLAVCIGLDDTGDRPEDYDAILAQMRERDLELICANPDIVVEMGEQLYFCAGAIAQRYAARGGRVTHAGKPHAAIYDRAFAIAEDLRGPTEKARVLAIGDAIATDIEGAANQGLASLLITSGIHRARLHHANGGGELDAAALSQFVDDHAAKPTSVLPRLIWEV